MTSVHIARVTQIANPGSSRRKFRVEFELFEQNEDSAPAPEPKKDDKKKKKKKNKNKKKKAEPVAVESYDPMDNPITDLTPAKPEDRQKNFRHRVMYYGNIRHHFGDGAHREILEFVQDVDDNRRPVIEVMEDVTYFFYKYYNTVVRFTGFLPRGYEILWRSDTQTYYFLTPNEPPMRVLKPPERKRGESGVVKLSEGGQEVTELRHFMQTAGKTTTIT